MGNSKFKLSDMIPNAWFYKLRDMGKNNTYRKKKSYNTSSSSSSLSNSSSLFSSSISATSIPPKNKQPQISHHRESNYFTRELSDEEAKFPILETKLPNSPIKSPKQRIRNRGNGASLERPNSSFLVSSDSDSSFSITNFKSFDSKFDISDKLSSTSPVYVTSTNFIDFEMISETKLPNSLIGSPKQRKRNRVLPDKPKPQVPISSDSKNSIIDNNFQTFDTNSTGFYPISKTKLPPIITKKKTEVKKEKKINPLRKHSTGVRLRLNSPRIGKINENGRKSFSSGRRRQLSDSLAVVKSSLDPQKDFRESMVEMILQNNINNSKELEDLLACYLELNCDKYHELIIKVFKQIWFETAIVTV